MITLKERLNRLSFTPAKQIAFLEDLATLLDDGVPPYQAVEILAHSAIGVSFDVAQDVLKAISEGKYVADGMYKWFPQYIVEIVRAGEEGGTLAKTLISAEEALTQKSNALNSIFNSLSYPIIVIVAGLIVSVFINHSIFVNFRGILPIDQWPQVSRDVAVFSSFVQDWWFLVLFWILLAIIGISYGLCNYVGRARDFIDNLPILSLYRQFTAARFMQMLGLLIANGVMLKRALKILQHGANPYLAWHLLTMEYRLGGGQENIAEVLDTGLIDKSNLVRLHIIARGKGFEHALQRQGRHLMVTSNKTVHITAKIIGGFLMIVAAALAMFLVYGIYSVGFSVGATQ